MLGLIVNIRFLNSVLSNNLSFTSGEGNKLNSASFVVRDVVRGKISGSVEFGVD